MYNSTDPAEADAQAAEEAKKYSVFWKEFGKAIKLGIIEDAQNRQRLAKLLRFETSRSGGKQIGLDAYITGMKEGQKSMYYLAGESTRVILRPHKQLQAFTIQLGRWFCLRALPCQAWLPSQTLAIKSAFGVCQYF